MDKNQEVLFDIKYSYKIFRFRRKKTSFQNWIHRLKIIRETIINYDIKQVIITGEFSIWVIPLIKIVELRKSLLLSTEQS